MSLWYRGQQIPSAASCSRIPTRALRPLQYHPLLVAWNFHFCDWLLRNLHTGKINTEISYILRTIAGIVSSMERKIHDMPQHDPDNSYLLMDSNALRSYFELQENQILKLKNRNYVWRGPLRQEKEKTRARTCLAPQVLMLRFPQHY
jgi:hypothetical protein